MKIMTEAIHFTADQKLLMFIENKLHKLERMYERIIDVHVILKLESHQSIRDKTVSYTHLDVYKRQDIPVPVITFNDLGGVIFFESKIETNL